MSSSRNTNNSLSRDNELSANLTVNNIDLQQSIVSNTIDIDLRNSSFNVVGTRTPQEQNQIPLHVGQQATEVNTSNIDLSNLSQQPNDPNTNDIDLGNINESPSKQILVSSKQKKYTGTLVNRTSKPLKSQPEKEDNNAGISGFPGGSTPGQLTGNRRAWHGICFKITSRRPGA